MPLTCAWADAASDSAAEARLGSIPLLAVAVGLALGAVVAVAAGAEPLGAVVADGSAEGSDVPQPAAMSTTAASPAAARVTPSPTPIRATRWLR